jgi:GT2 family glycosyltransferase
MTPAISVVIPAHNPRADYLELTLQALRGQSLAGYPWELVVVDNKSEPAIEGRIDVSWHPMTTIVREEALGLTRARLKGFEASRGTVVVLVDDDNVLAPDFLERTAAIAQSHPFIGAWGGVIAPRFEDPALAPPASLHALLTLRTASQDSWSNDTGHHASTPWGAGLCVRRSVATAYAEALRANPKRQALDLQGKRLLYGGDTDIAFTACRMGLGKGVFPALRVEHLIPVARCSREYLCRVAEGRGYSEVLHEFVLTERLPVELVSMGSSARRLLRRLRASPLERAVMSSHERGRRQALEDLRPQ